MKPTITLAVLLLGLSSVYGQDISNVSIEEVTIETNRIETTYEDLNSTVFVYTREQIQSLPVQSLNEVLTYIAGVDMQQRGPFGVQSDVSLRGGTFEQTLILVNGIKMSDPQTGHHNLNLPVDLDQIERIEVLKSSASRIYGINALAGAINIVTKVPNEPTFKAGIIAGDDFQQGANDRANLNFGADFGFSYNVKKYRAYWYYGHDRSSGYRPNTDYSQHRAFYQGEILNDNSQTTVMGSFLNNSFGANSFYAFPFDTTSWERVNTALVSIQHKHKVKKWTLKPQVYWRFNSDNYLLRRDDPEFFENNHETNVLGGEFHTTWQNKLGYLGLGLDLREEWIRSSNLGDHERFNFGLFAEHRFVNIADILDINVGLYFNYNSAVGVRVYPGADVGLKLTEGLKIFADVGTGLRLPSYTDLYYNGPANIGNPDLDPEEALSYEFGLKLNTPTLIGNASFFSRRTESTIDWVKDSLTAPWQPQNFEEVLNSGIDLSLMLVNPKAATYKGGITSIGIQYTYISAALKGNTETISRYALSQLKHQLVMNLDYKLFGVFYHSFKVRYTERLEQEGYWLLDTRFAIKTKGTTFFFDITNLLDKDYVESGMVPMPGRWFRFGANFNLAVGKGK